MALTLGYERFVRYQTNATTGATELLGPGGVIPFINTRIASVTCTASQIITPSATGVRADLSAIVLDTHGLVDLINNKIANPFYGSVAGGYVRMTLKATFTSGVNLIALRTSMGSEVSLDSFSINAVVDKSYLSASPTLDAQVCAQDMSFSSTLVYLSPSILSVAVLVAHQNGYGASNLQMSTGSATFEFIS